MIDPQNDEEFGPYGRSAVAILNLTFPNTYKFIIVVSPSFDAVGGANIFPQFDRGESFIISTDMNVSMNAMSGTNIRKLMPSADLDAILDIYRYEHAILASADLSVLTAWAQAEYAVLAFRGSLLDHYMEWLQTMQTMGVVRKVP